GRHRRRAAPQAGRGRPRANPSQRSTDPSSVPPDCGSARPRGHPRPRLYRDRCQESRPESCRSAKTRLECGWLRFATGGEEILRERLLRAGVFAVIVTAMLLLGRTSAPGAGPVGFRDEIALTGLTNPTAVRFSPDGRIFVAEKSGLIKVFDSLSDPSPKTFADLRTNVHNFWDRGLLGIALDPAFPAQPYVYVLYTYDAAIGG